MFCKTSSLKFRPCASWRRTRGRRSTRRPQTLPRRGRSVCGRRLERLPRVRLQLAQGRNLRLEVLQKIFSGLHLLLGLAYSIDECLPCLPYCCCGREFALPRASFLERFSLRRLFLEIAFD